jgi:hypothetical protein
MASANACPHVPDCALYPSFQLASNLALWRERYCTARFETCVRYQLAEQGERVPPLLLPNGALLKKVK